MRDARLTLGIIGYGNMGRALALGISGNERLNREFSLAVYENNPVSAAAAADSGIVCAQTAPALVEDADFVLIAVKPNHVAPLLREIEPKLRNDHLLLSIAAGVTLDFLREHSKGRCPTGRIMPNTPALVGRGIFGLCFGSDVPEKSREAVRGLLKELGLLIEVEEGKMSAITALSGSGPGYVFHFLESLAEAGVSVGLDRGNAAAIALELLRGSAEMAAKSGLHPALLREQVTSPAGTTIAGINVLDRGGARGLVVDAVRAACERSLEMEKNA
ncbi:MAG: pyrroline-5-carboxylate reductase [Desulfovibrio sp.]|jgi:pyrroline-5-carboxylate reductase|nr:pyrroline-5-carboxylate reductase [Desulfovibrio sp.]